MGHVSALFLRDFEGLFADTYFRRIDNDARTPTLLAKLRLRGYDDELVRFAIGEAIAIPASWDKYKSERIKDRQARHQRLAAKLNALAKALRDDPELYRLTTLDAMCLAQAYAQTPDLKTDADNGILAGGLPSLDGDLTATWPEQARRTVTIQGGPMETDYPALTRKIGWGGQYPLPTLGEYLTGVARALELEHWPNNFDATQRQFVPHKKGAQTALRTYVLLSVFDLLTETIDTGAKRAPNEETATLTNILLALDGSNEVTADNVTNAREDTRRRYWTESNNEDF